MKKIAAFFLAICSAFLALGFAACKFSFGTVVGGVLKGELVLDTTNFNSVITYKGEIPYDDIGIITKTDLGNSVTGEVKVPCEESMIVSGGETDTVGVHELVIEYNGERLTLEYTVKYLVEFMAFDEVVHTQHVLTGDEIVYPDAPEKDGYTFAYWEPPVSTVLTDNVTIVGHYFDDTKAAPALLGTQVVYDPNGTIASLTLPSNAYGAWVFVDDPETKIGDVGTREFDVRFIPATDELSTKDGKFSVTVTPKPVTFTIGRSIFVYDGQPHATTYMLSEDVAVEMIGSAQTNAGKYNVTYVVIDPNYEGYYSGSFTITKPDVKVTVHNQTMQYGDTLPTFEYTVEGFENVDVLNINVEAPSVNSIGRYDLVATVANDNVNVTIVNGALTVEKGDLAGVGMPTLSTATTPAIYESPLSSITLTGDYRGVWSWKYPTAAIKTMEAFTSVAVFTPNNANYNVIEVEVVIDNIDKRTLEITIVQSEFVYTSDAHAIIFEIEDGKTVTVDGQISQTQVGNYPTTLSINDTCYKGTKDVTLIVHKATPKTNFDVEFTRTWNAQLYLSDIVLPAGYTWDAPDTSLREAVGTFDYPATFTPADTHNFEIIHSAFTVTVEKDQGVLYGVQDRYEFTYEKDTLHKITGITSTPSNGEIKYFVNGEEVDGFKTVGVYEVTVKLLENAYYKSAEMPTVVEVLQAQNNDSVLREQKPTFGDLIGSLELPDAEFGKWSWEGKNNEDTVGIVGEYTFYAVFTPDDTHNYATRRVAVTISVQQQSVPEPTTIKAEYVYQGKPITVYTIPAGAPYTGTGLTAETFGDYEVVLTLTDTHNFKWPSTTGDTIRIPYSITQAPNAITKLTIENWTYVGEAIEPTIAIEANFGKATVKYYYAPLGSTNFTEDVPVQAGHYTLKAVIEETDNYAEAVETKNFEIYKDTLGVTFNNPEAVQWFNGIMLEDIELEAGFSWKQNQSIDVGENQEFAVVYTPNDTTNYNVEEGTVKVTVLRRTVTINGLQDSYTHVYNNTGYTISGVSTTPNATLKFEYSSGSAPVDHGDYTVTITLQDTTHYTFGTAEDCYVRDIHIAKASVEIDVTYNAYYEDTLGKFELPDSEYGTWSWKEGNDTPVGAFGQREHIAVFDSTSNNHKDGECKIIIQVSRLALTKPTLTQDSFPYTGETYTVLENTTRYTVANNSHSQVGEYTVTFTLVNDNYEWTSTSVDPTWEITKSVNTISSVTVEGFTFNDGSVCDPQVEWTFGTVEPTYQYYNVLTPDDVQDGLPTDAGTYIVIATSAAHARNYDSHSMASDKFTIEQATPTVNFTTVYDDVKWFNGITLADVAIDSAECEWKNPATSLEIGDNQTFKAIYEPDDTNYHAIEVDITVSVKLATPTLDVTVTRGGVKTELKEFTFDGTTLVVSAAASHTESTVEYKVNGEDVDAVSLTNFGEYKVEITLPESQHYEAKTWECTFNIKQAKASYTLPSWNPQSGDKMSTLVDPTVTDTLITDYEWIWKDVNGNAVNMENPVGNPGQTVQYKLFFDSKDNNYYDFDIDVTLTVGKTMVTPTLEKDEFDYANKDYKAEVKVSGVPTGLSYEIEYINDFTNVGDDHIVRLTMSDESFKTYSWNGTTEQFIDLTVTIKKVKNTISSVTVEGFTFNDGSVCDPQVEWTFGTVEPTYQYYNVLTPDDVQDGLPTDAGTYIVIATSAAHARNYDSDSMESNEFTIEQATPDEPTVSTIEIKWAAELTLDDVELGENFEWKNPATSINVVADATGYLAIYTPSDPNYHAIEVTIPVEVTLASASIDGIAEDGYTHVYTKDGYTLTGITGSHTESELQFTYKRDGEDADEIKLAGTYEVTITLPETEHYEEVVETTTVIVEQNTDNGWKNAEPTITIDKWEFDATTVGAITGAKALFGDVITEFKPQGANDDEYTLTNPITNKTIGKWTARCYVAETPEWEGVAEVTINFEITQATVTVTPGQTSFPYTSNEHTVTVSLNKDLVENVDYTVTNNTATNYKEGGYEATVTLLNTKYKFANGTNVTTIPFTVNKVEITLGEWTITDGAFGVSAPSASVERTDTNDFPVEIKYYYDTNRDGAFANEFNTLTEKSAAKKYYVIAKVIGTDNYDDVTTEPVEVKIAQATPDESLVQKTYTVEQWSDGLTLASVTPTGTGDGTYAWVLEEGKTPANIALNATTYEWKILFTPKDTNYKAITVDVTLTVNPKQVTIPTTARLTDGTATTTTNPTYNGNAWSLDSTLTNADYDITVIGATSATNASETITVRFTLKANRVWAGTTATTETYNEVTYAVQKAPNAITGFTYDPAGNHTITATNKSGEIKVYFSNAGENDWSETMPSVTGSYDVKVVIGESTNYQAKEQVFESNFQITKQSIDLAYTQSATSYTGEAITVTITIKLGNTDLTNTLDYTVKVDGTAVTLTNGTFTVTNAKTYTVEITLDDSVKELYKWSNEETETATTSFDVTISKATNGWSQDDFNVESLLTGNAHDYDASSQTFSRPYNETVFTEVDEAYATTKFGTPTITYYKVVNGKATQIDALSNNAGDYKIVFTVAANDNYDKFEATYNLHIEGIATTISTLPTYTQNQYQDQFPFTTAEYGRLNGEKDPDPVATVEGTTETVSGVFTYGEYTILNKSNKESVTVNTTGSSKEVSGGVFVKFTLTFTPSNPNYATATVDLYVQLKSVAHITTDSGETRTYYGTVESALAKATGKCEVWILPDKTGNVVINDTDGDGIVTIAKGVTLVIPFNVKANDYVPRNEKGGYADADGRNPEGKVYNLNGGEYILATPEKMYSNVILKAGVTLSVSGELEIAGRLGGGESSKFMAGQTYNSYAQMTLEDDAFIVVNDGGKLNLTGYIRGAGGQVTIDNGADLYLPFILNDHHGGSYMGQVVLDGNAAPFNRYQFRNIEQTLLRINYGGEMYVYANMFGDTSANSDGSYNHAEALFVASTGVSKTTAVINLTNSTSYMTSRFSVGDYNGNGKYDDGGDHYPYTKFYLDVCEIHIYNGATLEQLSLTLEGNKIESKNFDFPIPIGYDITLHSGSYAFNNAVKLLPGAKLTVDQGATLTATKLSVYTYCHFALSEFGDHKFYCEEAINIPAVFTVNGTFNCTTFGGIIYTNTAGAKVVISTATSSVQETGGKTALGAVAYIAYSHKLSLEKSGGGNAYTAAGTYYSDGSAWYKNGETVTTTFMANGASHHAVTATGGANGLTLTASHMPTMPTREHYTFSHWCLNDGCTNGDGCPEAITAGYVSYGNQTFYAAWTADTYTLQFINVLPEGSTASSNLSNVTFTVETEAIDLVTPDVPEEGANFAGWYTAKTNGTKVDAVDIAEIAASAKANNGVVVLYAVWVGEKTYTVNYQAAASTKRVSYAISSGSVKESETGSFTPTATANIGTFENIKKDPTKQAYFDGWYTDSSYSSASKWSGWSDSLVENDTLTLYGRWVDKYEVTFNTTTNVDNAKTATIQTVYLYDGQSYDGLSSYATEFDKNDSNIEISRYFNGWTIGNGTISGNTIKATADTTVTAVWVNKVKVNITPGTTCSWTVKGSSSTLKTFYLLVGEKAVVSASHSGRFYAKVTISATGRSDASKTASSWGTATASTSMTITATSTDTTIEVTTKGENYI